MLDYYPNLFYDYYHNKNNKNNNNNPSFDEVNSDPVHSYNSKNCCKYNSKNCLLIFLIIVIILLSALDGFLQYYYDFFNIYSTIDDLIDFMFVVIYLFFILTNKNMNNSLIGVSSIVITVGGLALKTIGMTIAYGDIVIILLSLLLIKSFFLCGFIYYTCPKCNKNTGKIFV